VFNQQQYIVTVVKPSLQKISQW